MNHTTPNPNVRSAERFVLGFLLALLIYVSVGILLHTKNKPIEPTILPPEAENLVFRI